MQQNSGQINPESDPRTGMHPKPESKKIPVVFSGMAGEFFKIWIVNLFLTVVTLGIYSAWAKVRTRRYFYANTRIDGFAFDYLARPLNILIGHLIVAVFFIAYSVAGKFNSMIAGLFVLAFYLILPYLLYKSVRFYTHNSAYRNIRFQFHGTLWESYQLYLLLPILIPLTMGLFFPYWRFLQKRWFFENTAFGSTLNQFSGRASQFYKTYILAFLQVVLLIVVFSIFMVVFVYATGLSMPTAGPEGRLEFMKAGVAAMFGFYVIMIFGSAMVQQYLFARITNYCWQQSCLGPVRILSHIRARKMIWIRITNIIVIVFSMGLMIPWARIRRTKYITSCMQAEITGSFDYLAAASGEDVLAVGDAATDFFDFDIGL